MSIQKQKLAQIGLAVPEIFFPAESIAYDKWAVIACDQHTSYREYWDKVDKYRDKSPSSLDLVFPEVYLDDPDSQERIQKIQENMLAFLKNGVLKSKGEGWVYVRRTTAESGLRQGLVVAVDLEKYDFSQESTSLIRSTEKTILERLPPRIDVRKNAELELPHIMILIDDDQKGIMESLEKTISSLEKIYDIDLMLGGGKLQGYWVNNAEIINEIATKLEKLADSTVAQERYGNPNPFLFAMGDGNHSLATAKAVWEELKEEHVKSGGKNSDLEGHPARYALAELVNIYSPGLRFEPIHRCLFSVDTSSFFDALGKTAPEAKLVTLESENAARSILEANHGAAVFHSNGHWYSLTGELGELAPAVVDKAFSHCKTDDSKIDFIHGWDHCLQLSVNSAGNISAFFNVIRRKELFGYVVKHGALPRKAFSMGDAQEKRYYFEARRVGK